jgi:hypothetical protein
MRQRGTGLTSRRWQHCQLVPRLTDLPDDAAVYSNAADAIQFLTGRAAKFVPNTYFPSTGAQRPDYPEKLAAMTADLRAHGGWIVHVAFVPRRHLPSGQDLERDLPLDVVYADQDGTIYSLRAPQIGGSSGAAR